MNQALEICVKYNAYLRRSDATGLFVSWCPLLDLKSQGTTVEQAKASLNDSVRLFVRHCYQRGILEDVLKGLGLEPEPYDGDTAPEGEDADGDHRRESVSVRSIPMPAEGTDPWEPWTGEVPLHLVAAAQLQKLTGAGAWPQ